MTHRLQAVLRRNFSAALRKGDLAAAGEVLERLKAEAPLAVETRGMELDLLLNAGRLSEARPLAEQLLTLFPGSARIQYLAGQLSYKEKDYAGAAALYEESLRLHPSWVTSRALGKAWTQQGKLEKAAAVLEPLAAEHPQCLMDLAWLNERRGELDAALGAVDRYLEAFPASEFGRSYRQKLLARTLEPGDLEAEVEGFLELGEEVPEEIVPAHVANLLRTGQGQKAREFLQAMKPKLPPRVLASVGWECYKLQAYDLAYELFIGAFAENGRDYKFLSSLETAARKAGRVDELARFYRSRLPAEKHLFGRLKRLGAGGSS